MPTWYEGKYMTAEDARKEADKFERLAKAAERDGDTRYELLHKITAADYREIARQREITNE